MVVWFAVCSHLCRADSSPLVRHHRPVSYQRRPSLRPLLEHAVCFSLAETVTACILFLLSRKLGREFIEQKFHLKVKHRAYAPDNAGFWTALILRINPLVPFRFMDVGFGLTKLPFRQYFWAVVLGSPLRIFWLQFAIAGMGEAVLEDPTAMRQYFQTNKAALYLTVTYILTVLVLTAGVFIGTLIKRRVLQRQLENLQ